MIDAGHFHTEDVVIEPLCQQLRDAFPEVEVLPYHLGEIHTL